MTPGQHFFHPPKSLLGRIIAVILTGAFIVLALTFSLLALPVLLIGGAIFAGWLWWKTRALRRAMREARPAPDHPPGGGFIDGECVRETSDDDLRR